MKQCALQTLGGGVPYGGPHDKGIPLFGDSIRRLPSALKTLHGWACENPTAKRAKSLFYVTPRPDTRGHHTLRHLGEKSRACLSSDCVRSCSRNPSRKAPSVSAISLQGHHRNIGVKSWSSPGADSTTLQRKACFAPQCSGCCTCILREEMHVSLS